MTQSSSKPIRVLVADDAPDVRLLLKLGLQRPGKVVIVDEACDGREAVRKTAEHRPDLIILDISMPVMDGLQAATEIRARFPETVIVMYSGFRATDLERKSIAAGADVYAEKDGDIAALEKLVLELGRSRSRGPSRRE